jgi:hypothetical protein
MVEPSTQNTAADDTDAPAPGWRFRVGVILIAVGFLSPLGALLLPFTDLSTAMKATLSGLLLAGIPEVFTVAAVAVMGKSGFAYVKSRIMALLRRYGPPKEVGPTRYYIGLAMFLIPAIYAWIIMYAPPEMVPGFPEYRIHMGLTIDFIFVCSFFVLGGDFWDKLRALFIHKAKARFPVTDH